jgi:uncharacterized protein (TIGR02145 family)
MNKKITIVLQLFVLVIFIIGYSCKKQTELIDHTNIIEAYPGINGNLEVFMINGQKITCEKINGQYVFQGDIILTEDQLLYSDTTKGAGLPKAQIAYLWPDGEVYYQIDESASAYSDDIMAAINEIEKYTTIKFIKHTIQIGFISFEGSSNGSYSNLGMMPGGQKIMLGWSSKGTVIHEICHALGMIHEFSRSDRDDYVNIKWDNIVDLKEYNFEIVDCVYKTLFFDFNSIMMYPSVTTDKNFAIDIKAPIITKKDGNGYTYNYSDLSDGDIQLINLMYSGDYSVNPPIVVTTQVADIATDKATVGGKINFSGNASITDAGIIWRKSSDPESENIKTSLSKGLRPFSTILTGLIPGTQYVVKAYATNIAGTSYGDELSFTTNTSGSQTGTVSDIDGNIYDYLTIGTQKWMVENLKVTKYNNGTAIQNVTGNTQWGALATGSYCWYDNNISNKDTYGALYNWFAVSTGNLCPAGWHVPSSDEWTVLENTLITGGYNYDNTTTGNKIAKALTSTSLWGASATTGTPGNTDYPEFRNKSGFTAVPAGYRFENDGFQWINLYTVWWSMTASSSLEAETRSVYYDWAYSHTYIFDKNRGFSVRCIKNN